MNPDQSPASATPTPAQVRRGRLTLVLIAVLFFGSALVAGLLRFLSLIHI